MRTDPRSDYANRLADRVTLVKPITRKIKLLSRTLRRFPLLHSSLSRHASWILNIHILPGVNFKNSLMNVKLSTNATREKLLFSFSLSPSLSLSLSLSFHLFDLSIIKPGPDTFESRNVVLFPTRNDAIYTRC